MFASIHTMPDASSSLLDVGASCFAFLASHPVLTELFLCIHTFGMRRTTCHHADEDEHCHAYERSYFSFPNANEITRRIPNPLQFLDLTHERIAGNVNHTVRRIQMLCMSPIVCLHNFDGLFWLSKYFIHKAKLLIKYQSKIKT